MMCRITTDSTEGAFCSFELTFVPGEGIPLHLHAKDSEYYYILEGELEMRCDDHVFVAKTGTMVFIPKTIPHSFYNKSDKLTKVLNLFLLGGFDHLVTELSELSAKESADQQKRE